MSISSCEARLLKLIKCEMCIMNSSLLYCSSVVIHAECSAENLCWHSLFVRARYKYRSCVIGRAWRLVDSMFLTANLKEHVNFLFLPFEVQSLECTSTLSITNNRTRDFICDVRIYIYCGWIGMFRISSQETKHKYYCHRKRGPMTIKHTSISPRRKNHEEKMWVNEQERVCVCVITKYKHTLSLPLPLYPSYTE